MKEIFYVVTIAGGGTYPEPLVGPFKTYKGMLKRARKVYNKQKEEDSIFYLVLTEGSMPRMTYFTHLELE